MSRTVKLLLTESVDNLGIVGDVVTVKVGYARNYLLPRGFATAPSDDLINQLADKRKQAEADVAALRKQRESLIGKIDGLEMTLTRACNDQGHLYGSVTQQDIAAALTELGFPVKAREVRLAYTIKRVDKFDVTVKFDADLEANINLWVEADRTLDVDDRDEMEFDNEGNLIEKPAKSDVKPEEKADAQPAAAE